ncbi:hypothetical protein GHT06_016899 [Daphnia sinensis]|uniref:Peptidase S1 domain-containing protein n=1 Tax=Daphnia sinensis TaxID=1820382 RepID=A0AAD5PRG6_9CRUS|nr:hypothetical protein GHT06_016899 [Daphnia sinensis]
MNLHVALLCVFLASAVVGKPQISFGEEEEEGLVQVNPEGPAQSEGADVEDELIQTRLGLLAGYLNLEPVPGAVPLGEQKKDPSLKPNPYVPEVDATSEKQAGRCLCVPVGKCASPVPNVPLPPPGSGPLPPPPIPGHSIPPPSGPHTNAPVNTDGAGLIDVRIVNRPPAGVRCQNNFQYCCAGNNAFPVAPPAPVQGSCGRSNIIPTPGYNLDVTQARFGEFPWMVVILGPTNNYVGGGVLVSPRHVVTAAHKVANFGNGVGLKVRLGEWDAKANVEPLKYVELGVSRVKVNPFFNRANLQNDIAVLTLEQPVNLASTPHINPVCPANFQANYVGRRCLVAGWGKDAFGPPGNFQYILKKVDVPVLDSNDCEQRLRRTRLGPFFQLSRSSFVCAGGEAGKDACTGDGGSPLVCEVNGRFELVGLVAWGIGCAEQSLPGVYVNVRSYADWLNSELV